MSIDISAFFDPNHGDAVKFDAIGDGVAGIIIDCQLIDDIHNPGKQVLVVKISTDDDVVKDLYVRSAGQRDAVGQAVIDAGCTAIDIGGYLSIEYVSDKILRNGKSMKIYSAKYEVPQSEFGPTE